MNGKKFKSEIPLSIFKILPCFDRLFKQKAYRNSKPLTAHNYLLLYFVFILLTLTWFQINDQIFKYYIVNKFYKIFWFFPSNLKLNTKWCNYRICKMIPKKNRSESFAITVLQNVLREKQYMKN